MMDTAERRANMSSAVQALLRLRLPMAKRKRIEVHLDEALTLDFLGAPDASAVVINGNFGLDSIQPSVSDEFGRLRRFNEGITCK